MHSTTRETLVPCVRWFQSAIAFVWFATGVLVLHPHYREIGRGHLSRLGLPDWLMYATCGCEVVLACCVAWRPPERWSIAVQIGLITGFTSLLAVTEPLLLVHPFGVLSKNLPLVALIVVSGRLQRQGWTVGTEWLLRAGMACVWFTEGLFPKILFHQSLEIDVVRNLGVSAQTAEHLITVVGVCQMASSVAVLVGRGRLVSLLLGGQLVAMVILPVLVIAHDPLTLVHPFGPHIKNVPIIVGTAVVFLRLTPFLSANWSNVVLFSYAVPAGLLESRLPLGVTLDTRDGHAFLSFVSLDFSRVRVLGVPLPGFRQFPDLNLRFYVRSGERRGVVFVRELVPFRTVAWVARSVFGEPFDWAVMSSSVASQDERTIVQRSFTRGGRTQHIHVEGRTASAFPQLGSDAQFLIERYWGFGRARCGETIEFRVTHPEWQVRTIERWTLELDWLSTYGPDWQFLQQLQPHTIDWAVGSAAEVWISV